MPFNSNFYSSAFGRNENKNFNEERELLVSAYNSHTNTLSINGKEYPVGVLVTPTLKDAKNELRNLSQTLQVSGNVSIKAKDETGNVFEKHQSSNSHVIMAASQFNLLEFIDQFRTPELGITCYSEDRTQGPACAMAAPFATAYRNYLVRFKDGIVSTDADAQVGQTSDKQINTLSDTMKLLNQKYQQSGDININQRTQHDEEIPNGELLFFKNGYIDSTDANLTKLKELVEQNNE